MKVNELTKTEYFQTMIGTMQNVTDIAEPIIDIWEYAKALKPYNILSEEMLCKECIEAVYTNDINTYHHILLLRR